MAVERDPRIFDPARLAAVRDTGLLDTDPEPAFDDLARLAKVLLDAPFAFVTLVDDQRSFWKGRIGLPADGPSQNTVDESFCQYVIRSGEPLMIGDAAADPLTAKNPSIDAMGVAAWAGVPLMGPDGLVLGSFCVVDQVVRQWTDRDAEVLRVLSRSASREIALRSMDAAQRDAATEREDAAARLALLADVSAVMTETLNAEYAVARLAGLVVPVLGDWAVVAISDDDGQLRDVGWWHHDVDKRELVEQFAGNRLEGLAPRGATHEARFSNQPAVVASNALEIGLEVLSSPVAREAFSALAPSSYAVFPLVAGTSVAGVLGIVRGHERAAMNDKDLELGRALAYRAGLALGNARLFEQQKAIAQRLREANDRIRAASAHDRRVSRALQDAMLTRLPSPHDAQLVARYLTADEADQVGGDWYDAVLGSNGAMTLIIGDVAGHDIAAAGVMGQLRNLLRAFTWNDPADSPAALIARLDHAMRDLRVAVMTTLAVVRVDPPLADDRPGVRNVRWSCAGHPPPVLAHPDGRCEMLPGSPDLPLGIDPRSARRNHRASVGLDDTLLLFTDGLIETRHIDPPVRMQQLFDVLGHNAAKAPAAVLDAVLDEMVGGQPSDDVAVLAARFARPS